MKLSQLTSLPLLVVLALGACDDSPITEPPAAETIKPLPGEVCDAQDRADMRLVFDPPSVVVAPGEHRPVRITVEPDFCDPNVADFTSADANIAAAPGQAQFDLRHATYDFNVVGGALGKTTIKAKIIAKNTSSANRAPVEVTAELPVDVREAVAPGCRPEEIAGDTLNGGRPSLGGTGGLAKAKMSFPSAAFTRIDEFAVPSFPASVGCEQNDLVGAIPEAKLKKLGPAVTFGAKAPVSMAKQLRREMEVAMPVNPALFPPKSRLRHLVVLYKGPRAKTPRPIPVANPRIDADGDGYVLKFSTPWFGTYQAAVAEDAGTKTRKRRLTHRAVIGFSMGGGGAASFGMRHHDKFDVVAPLGGPSDWTWLLWYIENYALGGFCPEGKTCPKLAPNQYPFDDTFAHSMDFDNWFYERGNGNGGSFPRAEYVQIFEDLALAMGNPNGSSTDPGLLHMVLGPKKTDPWMAGDPSIGLPPGVDCSYTIEPIKPETDSAADKAEEQRQKDVEAKCRAWRCDPKNAWKAPTNYFDDEYNPDGTKPVISFCDGAQDPKALSPYANGWAPGGNKPVNMALAVDLNNNGIRDEGEPIIRSGHEPYDDCGLDGLCDPQEPGYDPETNPDPNQDDYDYQLNPSGTEGNHRYDVGEPYKDFGLDGVANTASRHIAGDPGEGDGKFTESIGLANFYQNDAHGILERRVTQIPGGPLTDDALKRVDILSDGGIRDLFNFAVVANHLTGQVFARQGANKLPLRTVAFYNGFHFLPGQPTDKPNFYNPFDIRWADVADFPSVRYGDLDIPKKAVKRDDVAPGTIEYTVDDGDGQHVGTGAQILYRLETAFFYVGQRWPDADRRQTVLTSDGTTMTQTVNELGVDCEAKGKCEKMFTGPKSGRTGPISVTLPPGYALEANKNVRYPVLYVLHGYGQDPRDLSALAVFTNNFMNGPERSYATRLPKFIVVYGDGRCRMRPDGKPECIRGTFYLNSARPDGVKLDDWFDEVIDYVDKNYRTMPTTEVEVTE
ncbi:MAG: hypothetical protein JST00_26005 [Deltaproteobacteria bacterium]|nr:hypothetical protein [Deltaproteobacteria bacterium]